MENTKNASLSKLVPVMLCFFAMGFVDLVGIASNYVKADLGSDRLTSKHLPFIGVFLVSDFLRTDRYADEPYRSEENRVTQFDRDFCFFTVACLRGQLRTDADFFFPVRYWKRTDADFTEPASFQHRSW